jgi:hypothetical protein
MRWSYLSLFQIDHFGMMERQYTNICITIPFSWIHNPHIIISPINFLILWIHLTSHNSNWKFENILPLSLAHAATPSTFVVKNNYASVPNFSYLSPNTMAGKFLAYNGNVLDHIVGNRPGKSAVAGVIQAEIETKLNDRILSELGKYEFGQTIYL